jgi:predicted DNA-binding antitoxin AbrB/MazE fold protein
LLDVSEPSVRSIFIFFIQPLKMDLTEGSETSIKPLKMDLTEGSETSIKPLKMDLTEGFETSIKPLKIDLTEGSETSEKLNMTPGKYPKDNIQDSEHGENLK